MLVSVLTLRADKIVPIGLTLIAYELEPPLTLIAELVSELTLRLIRLCPLVWH